MNCLLIPSIKLDRIKVNADLMRIYALRSTIACNVVESNKQQSDFRDDTKISFKTKYTD